MAKGDTRGMRGTGGGEGAFGATMLIEVFMRCGGAGGGGGTEGRDGICGSLFTTGGAGGAADFTTGRFSALGADLAAFGAGLEAGAGFAARDFVGSCFFAMDALDLAGAAGRTERDV